MDNAHQIHTEDISSIEKYQFRELYNKIIQMVNGLENEISKNNLKISTHKWFDLLALVAYWIKRGCVLEEIISKIEPGFIDEHIQMA